MSNRLLVALTGAGAVGIVLAGTVLAFPAQAASVPYTDSRVQGYLSLCDAAGKPITGGQTATTPFVAAAIGSTAAPAPYNVKGATATLYAYQPRQQIDPGEWSGEQLTGSAQFSSSAHPMAVSTLLDSSLADFVADFPPKWDGFVQLRIYLSAPNQSVYSLKYDAADIQVTGSTWKVIRGGSALCGTGTATSNEDHLIPQQLASASASASRAAAAAAVSGASNAPTSSTANAASSAAAGASAEESASASRSSSGAVPTASAADKGSSSDTAEIAGLGVAVVIVAAGGGIFWWRRNRASN